MGHRNFSFDCSWAIPSRRRFLSSVPESDAVTKRSSRCVPTSSTGGDGPSVTVSMSKTRQHKFRQAVLAWAEWNLRDYPWRRPPTSSYDVLVAELLLKRTTATAAARAYGSFVEKYPTVDRLVLASEVELTHLLEPIGLSRQRARAIKQLAQVLVLEYKGRVPGNMQQLNVLPGIGDYASRAIMSFGHGMPVAVVDSNVERVLRRVFGNHLVATSDRTTLQRIADDLLPRKQHRDFNFALLDLGSLICRPARPLCDNCPIRRQCDYALGVPHVRPCTLLRNVRQANGIPLSELAKKAGVSKLTIVNIEARRITPRVETLTKIAKALGVSVQEIKDDAVETTKT